jgi:hypothetical protein
VRVQNLVGGEFYFPRASSASEPIRFQAI